ncbi:hypothetical protein Ocin01_13030 [Orchesella cincta]|uniref:CHK kinase-like domain-containing protein n=1 Tax=Orchesella cincta TaxID=48709 RepID=A0A1D2MLC8_ORCCI|nr:hypothetical protein Ocin01_13030 [Orchesella cincta]
MTPAPKFDTEETPDEVSLKYKSILKSNGIHDEVSEVIVKHSGLQGAGMASQQLYVTVKFADTNKLPLNLFVKAHTSNPSHSEMIDAINSFENESRFFMEYIPAAKEFCKSKGHDGLVDFYPKCYYGDKSIVVFENLVLDKGYSLLKADEKQDMDAVRFAITNLAKHHAISHAFIKEFGGPELFFARYPTLDLDPFSNPICQKIFGPMIENGIKTHIKTLERYDIPGRDTTLNKLKSVEGRSYDMIIDAITKKDSEEEKLFVLNHGDFWNNNMMFQKDTTTNKIVGHVAIDLQTTNYNSLGLDVGYYLFSSVKPSVRRAHWKEILEMYLATFKETVGKLGYPVQLSYEELLLIVRKKINFGFWTGLGFFSEATFVALRDINMNEVGDMENFHDVVDEAVQKWIEANPVKMKETAEELVMLLDDHDVSLSIRHDSYPIYKHGLSIPQMDIGQPLQCMISADSHPSSKDMSPVQKSETEETPNEDLLKYQSILKSNGIHDEVSEVIVKHSGLQGAGMGSQHLYATVKFTDPNIQPLNLFVKAHTGNPSHSEMIDAVKGFENETRFFTEYIPAAKELCKSKGSDGLVDFYPKCYYGDENMVVFENLVLDRGFSLLSADEKQDMEAVSFAIDHLAKHHAISYALINEFGGPGPFFTRFPTLDIDAFSTPAFQKMFGPVVESSVMSSINILERYNVPGRETAIQKLKSVLGKSYNLIIDAIKMQDSEKPFVLNHGDYWGNNMMFQMDKTTNKIIGHVSLDFQITCYNSLGLDVGYYLFTTVNPSVRRAHWKEILEIYLTTFNETVRKLGHPVDLSYEELLLNIRNKINYGFWIGMSLTNEAGITAFKNINMSELGSMENLSVEFNKQIQKWIDENPEKGKETAEELVKVLDEYSALLIQ